MVDELPEQAKRGRGAVGNPAGRYERFGTVRTDDGWVPDPEDDKAARQLPTRVHTETSRTVISRHQSPDMPDMPSVNPYRGCEHGCVYCYARPTHGYYGLSSGQDFETELFYKPDAPELLRRELALPSYRMVPLTLSGNTDCYQPIERQLHITRRLIQLLGDCRHPFTIITKSALVLRDLDLLQPLAAQNLVRVFISITTLDADLARLLEPRAATPPKRLEAVKVLADAGIPVGVMTAPIIPGLTDHEIEALVAAAAEHGARWCYYTLVRLPHEVKELFAGWLDTHRPERAKHVLNLIRQTRGGQLYDASFGQRHTGTGPIAELIAQRHTKACQRHGLNQQRFAFARDLFRPPRGDDRQLGLF
jgi:DNA repair photolyase